MVASGYTKAKIGRIGSPRKGFRVPSSNTERSRRGISIAGIADKRVKTLTGMASSRTMFSAVRDEVGNQTRRGQQVVSRRRRRVRIPRRR